MKQPQHAAPGAWAHLLFVTGLGLLFGLAWTPTDSASTPVGSRLALGQEHPQQPTPPFPTLIPTEPLPTLPPSVPTPAPHTPTTTLTPEPKDTPVTPTITPTPTATEPSATPSATSFLGLEEDIYLPWIGFFAEREEPANAGGVAADRLRKGRP